MVIFIDSSSLLKHYVEEEGSQEVDRIFGSGETICISPITTIEIHAALKRKNEDGSIDRDTYKKACDFWLQDYTNFVIVPFGDELINRTISIIDERAVKTLDAIQVASALLSGARTLVTSDSRMYQVMRTLSKEESLLI